MDETEIVKGTKLERVSLVLMNIASSNVGLRSVKILVYNWNITLGG